LVGWGTLKLKALTDQGLQHDFDNFPKHHLNIIGWGGPDSAMTKARDMQVAQIAAKSVVVKLKGSKGVRASGNPKFNPETLEAISQVGKTTFPE